MQQHSRKNKLAAIVCVLAGLLAACGSSPVPAEETAASTSAQPGSRYCQAFEDLVESQPAGALSGDALATAMNAYADSVERVAAMSLENEAVVLWELGAIARLVADDPSNREHAQRLGEMVVPAAPITIRASRSCQLDA